MGDGPIDGGVAAWATEGRKGSDARRSGMGEKSGGDAREGEEGNGVPHELEVVRGIHRSG